MSLAKRIAERQQRARKSIEVAEWGDDADSPEIKQSAVDNARARVILSFMSLYTYTTLIHFVSSLA